MPTQSDLASVSGTYTELVFFNFVTKLHVIGQPRSQAGTTWERGYFEASKLAVNNVTLEFC